jgi:hypothetical protein
MRALQCDTKICATGAAILGLTTMAASAALPEPNLNGVVVQDLTQSFSFDRIGTDVEIGPYVNEDAYQGTVRSLVIRAPDHTLDFYFHITASTGLLEHFVFSWQAPTSYTVAYHTTDAGLPWQPEGPSGPPPGASASGARSARTTWSEENTFAGSVQEAWFGLDTDATQYASTATFQASDSGDRIRGQWNGQSSMFTTFGPAIPEPETYALMLCGLGLLALGRRVRQRQ